MVLKINPSQQPVWRTPSTMQIGLGEDRVILEELTTAQEKLVAALFLGIADNQVEAIASQSKLDPKLAHSIVNRLKPLMQHPEPSCEKSLSPKVRAKQEIQPMDEATAASSFAEIIRASLVVGRDGHAVLLERSRRAIHIDELTKTGLMLSLGLAAAGVGAVVSHDAARVTAKDVGNTGYPAGLLGQPRLSAADWLLKGAPNRMRLIAGESLSTQQLDNLDAAVLIAHQAIEPRLYARWLNRQIPHIAIIFDVDGALVSPLIIPGQTACLFCLEQNRAESDEGWPVIASQLVTSELRFDDASSQLFAAGVVLKQLLLHLDDSSLVSAKQVGLGFRFDSSSGEVSEFSWPTHQSCSCRGSTGLEQS
jgi:hypothetical protein